MCDFAIVIIIERFFAVLSVFTEVLYVYMYVCFPVSYTPQCPLLDGACFGYKLLDIQALEKREEILEHTIEKLRL